MLINKCPNCGASPGCKIVAQIPQGETAVQQLAGMGTGVQTIVWECHSCGWQQAADKGYFISKIDKNSRENDVKCFAENHYLKVKHV